LDHRKWLIQVFVNAIYLYDDKMIITFNYKDGTATITLDDVKRAIKKDDPGSDLDCLGAPKNKRRQFASFYFFAMLQSRTRTHLIRNSLPCGQGVPYKWAAHCDASKSGHRESG
ncbi:MAG: hypothetical protein IKM13_04910, partial [Clostridia bacterium]|nr:hypothetical protein [Clostridia bacterium]